MNRNKELPVERRQGRTERMPAVRHSTFLSPFEELFEPPRLFNDFLSRFPTAFDWNTDRFLTPALDLEENDNEYMVYVDLPGVKKEDIKVECSDNTLSISAERSEETGNRRRGPSRRFYGSFQKTFTLPAGVVADQVRADFENGELTVHIPKGEEAKPRRIEIGERKAASSEKTQSKH